MTTEPLSPAGSASGAAAGKYLTFLLGHESYGVSVLRVREILRLMDITPVPRMPPEVKGVINLRGKVVPIVDLHLKFALPKAEVNERTCIVVVQIKTPAAGAALLGFIVDAVEEVLNIPAGDIEPTPDFGTHWGTDYILGLAKTKGRVKALLDMDRIMTAQALG